MIWKMEKLLLTLILNIQTDDLLGLSNNYTLFLWYISTSYVVLQQIDERISSIKILAIKLVSQEATLIYINVLADRKSQIIQHNML